METYFCDCLRSCDHDRRRSQKIEHKGWFPYDRGSQIADRNKVCDRLRSYENILLRSSAIPCHQLRLCDHMETKVLRSAIKTHPIIFRVLFHDSTLVCSIVISRNLWRKLLVMNVYNRSSKDFKDKNKKTNCWDKIGQKFYLSAGRAEAKFRNIRTAYGRYRIQNRCYRRFWS